MKRLTKYLWVFLAGVILASSVIAGLPLQNEAHAAPADAYWVGGTGNWSDATSHWATTSNGTPLAANLPSLISNVHFDANSANGSASWSVILDITANCSNMDWTGVSGSPTLVHNNNLQIYGNATFASALLHTGASQTRDSATSGTQIWTSNGTIFSSTVINDGANNVMLLGDDLVTLGAFNEDSATQTINTGNHSVTCASFTQFAGALVLGNSVFNAGTWTWNTAQEIASNNSTINISGATFAGGSKQNYNIVNLSGNVTVSGNNRYSQLNLSQSKTQVVTFSGVSSQTANSFDLSGSSGHQHTLQSSNTSNWNISILSGNVTADYVSVSRSTANITGGQTYNAVGASLNNGNNIGWTFPLTVTTQPATGVTMNKDGITGGQFNGTLVDMGGNSYVATGFAYGLTPLYGNSTTNLTKSSPQTYSNNSTQLHQVYGMGDSQTAIPGTYITQLQNLLGGSWNVNNDGVSGDTTAQMLTRFSNNVTSRGDAEYVIIWGGVNDVRTDITAAAIESNLQSMYTQSHNYGIKVVALTISPWKPSLWTPLRQEVTDNVNAWIANNATSVDYVIDTFTLLEDPANPDTLLPAYDDGGGLHLSDLGYNVTGTAVYNGVTWQGQNFPVNLIPGQTYHYTATANTSVTATGSDSTFTLTLPSVTTVIPTNVGMNGGTHATLNAEITSMGVATDTYTSFQYSTDLSFSQSTPEVVQGAIGTYSATITGFLPNQFYNVRAVNRVGSVYSYGTTQTFFTNATATFNLLDTTIILVVVALILFILSMMLLPAETPFIFRMILIAVATYFVLAILPGLQNILSALQ